MSALCGCVGIGLEEDTGMVVKNGSAAEVIGSGVVTVAEGRECSDTNIRPIKPGEPLTISNLRVHILSAGETYTLPVQDALYR